MTPLHKRLEVYAEDVMKLTGKSRKSADRIFKNIRELFKLEPKGAITVFHLARYYQITVEQLEERMRAISD